MIKTEYASVTVGVRRREAWIRFLLSIESFCGANFYGEEILALATKWCERVQLMTLAMWMRHC